MRRRVIQNEFAGGFHTSTSTSRREERGEFGGLRPQDESERGASEVERVVIVGARRRSSRTGGLLGPLATGGDAYGQLS
jgi:hypothetical protein